MEFRVEELAPCRKKVTVIVPADRVRKEIDGQYAEVNKQIALPGFRPGKAPRKLLESRFGVHVQGEVKQKLVEAAYKQLIEEKRIAPLTQPDVDVDGATADPARAFEFAFEVTTRPDFELPGWKGLEVKVPPVSVSDAEVDAGVQRMRLQEGDLVPSEAGAAADDVVVLDWEAVEGDAPVHAETSSYYRMGRGVLDGVVVDGLDAKLMGARGGDAFALRGKAPSDDPRPALAGREFGVRLKILEVKRFEPAELNEAFLKRHDFDDVDELKKDVRRGIQRAKDRERDRLTEERLIDRLVSSITIELPSEVVDASVTDWTERQRVEAQAEGRDADEVSKRLTADAGEMRRKVESDLRRHFVLEKISEAENISVAEQELVGAVEQIARDNGRSAGEVIQHFQEQPGRLAELRAHLKHEKAREALRKAATVIDETAPKPEPTPSPRKGK